MKINPERLGGGAMGEPMRCDCGDSDCASCGTAAAATAPVRVRCTGCNALKCVRCGGHIFSVDNDRARCLRCDQEHAAMEYPTLDGEREHYTDGRPCWCGPTIEHGRGDDGDVIIHRDKEEAH